MREIALLVGLLGCGPQGEAPDAAAMVLAAEPEVPGSWPERATLVREQLALIQAAHGAKDKDAAVASWQEAYRGRFEPLLEDSLLGTAARPQVVAAELAFGSLLAALQSPRPKPVEQALERVLAGE